VISCGTVERHLVDVVRHAASDAVRLELEAHLESCGGCRETRAAFGLLGALREQPPPRLGPAAEARIVEGLIEQLARTGGGGARSGPPLGPRRRSWPVAWTALASTALVALAFGAFAFVPRHRGRVGPAGAPIGVPAWGPDRLPGSMPSSAPADLPGTLPGTLDGQTLEATGPGVLAFEGAGVTYDRGTILTFHPAARTLTLVRGQVDIDVTEHRAVCFRVATPRFVVEVLGTRFVVTPGGVHTLRGRVRVLDPAGTELAIVSADEAWTAPAPPSTAAVQPRTAARVVVAAGPVGDGTPVTDGTPVADGTLVADGTPVAKAGAAAVAVAELVTRARAALAEGNARRARRLLERARLAGPSRSEWPGLELLQADALLVLRQPEHAIAAYRRVARRYPDAPEGETAAFVSGQLLFESGAGEEGAAVMNDYLARHPRGRFVREARERLAHPRTIE
jgi:hypothetical protein